MSPRDGLSRHLAAVGDTGVTPRRERRALLLLTLLALCAIGGQMIAMPIAMAEIDVSRDLMFGFAILDGTPWPHQGPEIGGMFHLGPWWFYLVAAVLAVTHSLTQYKLVMSALAGLKFFAAAWVGWRLGGPRLAALLVGAVALPGIAGYQFLGVSHANFVELFLWLTIAGALSLQQPGARIAKRLLTGLAFAAAVHAHPTAIAALPILLFAVARAGGGARRVLADYGWLALAGLASLLPVLPELTDTLGRAADPAARGRYARAVGDSAASVWPLLKGILWWEPGSIAGTALAHGDKPPLAFRATWIVLVAVGMLAALAGALTGRGMPLRRMPGGWWLPTVAICSTVWLALAAAVMTRVTPFYAAYMALVPLALWIALGWHALAALTRPAVAVVAILAMLATQWAVALGLRHQLAQGLVRLQLPDGYGVKAAARSAFDALAFSVADRDRLARWWCDRQATASAGAAPDPGAAAPTVAGPWATALDASHGYELRLAGGSACRDALRLGQGARTVVGLPTSLAHRLGVPFSEAVGAFALVTPRQVISPTRGATLAATQTYPVRLTDWEAATRAAPFALEFDAAAHEPVLVHPILALHMGWSAKASANGKPVTPIVGLANVKFFRCEQCTGHTHWRIELEHSLPELTGVIVLPAAPAGVADASTADVARAVADAASSATLP